MRTKDVGQTNPSMAVDALESWRTRQDRLQFTILAVAVGAAALLVAWLALGSDPGTLPATGTGPRIASQGQLKDFANTLGRPLYWAGPRAGFDLELTEATGNRIFIRYLPRGVAAGDPRPDFLSIGTYAREHAYADLRRASMRPGIVSTATHDGGLVVFDSKTPTSVYLGYPGARYQVEVFAPSSRTARSLALGGHITPVG